MAFVVRRPGGRFEIRESVVTPKGPRARSLATFRVLDDDVLMRASSAATQPLEPEAVRHSARRAGAPIEDSAADRLARQLLAEIGRGRRPASGLRRLLIRNLSDERSFADVEMDHEWLDASDEQRGRALRDLLDLTENFPARRNGPLRYPRLTSVRRG